MKTKFFLIIIFVFMFWSCGNSNKETTYKRSRTIWLVSNIELLNSDYARYYIQTIKINGNYNHTVYVIDTIGAFQPGDTVIFKLKR